MTREDEVLQSASILVENEIRLFCGDAPVIFNPTNAAALAERLNWVLTSADMPFYAVVTSDPTTRTFVVSTHAMTNAAGIHYFDDTVTRP